jgi:ABC-type lipoprotein release transport system permease subunit
MILKLVWRNLWRNKHRTFITMMSISFALTFAILMESFKKGVFDNLIEDVVSFYHGYIQIHKKGYWDEQILDNCFVATESLTKILKKNPHVKEVVPRLETFVLGSLGGKTKGCLLVGTDPEKEDNLTQLKSKIISGDYFKKDERVALVASGLAKRLSLNVHDTVILLGQGYHGVMAADKYLVKGIVQFGSPELNNGLIFLPISTAQNFLSAENMLTSISLGIDKPENMGRIQQDIEGHLDTDYEVMNWKQMMPEIDKHIKADGVSFYIFTGILYLIVSFGIYGTILMMTAERKFEFGMLVAIGMKKILLGIMLFVETFFITLLSLIVGFFFSLPFVIYFNRFPPRFSGEFAKAYEQFGFEPIFPTAIDPAIFLSQAAIVLVLAFIIGLYPLWYIFKLDSIEAMKK